MQYFLNKHSIHSYQVQGSNVLLAANEEIHTRKALQHAQQIRANVQQRELSKQGDLVEAARRPKVTAVLVNWKRPTNVIQIASALSMLSYVNDIVIYENNREDPITMEPPHVWPNNLRLKGMVRLIHSEAGTNLNTESRFRGCGEHAKNDVCKCLWYCCTASLLQMFFLFCMTATIVFFLFLISMSTKLRCPRLIY